MEYFDLTFILQIIVPVFTAFLIYITEKYIKPWILSRIELNNNELLMSLLDTSCKAAEEKYKEIAKSGDLKFAYVRKYLEGKGFTYDDAEFEVLIKGMVKELFNWDE